MFFCWNLSFKELSDCLSWDILRMFRLFLREPYFFVRPSCYRLFGEILCGQNPDLPGGDKTAQVRCHKFIRTAPHQRLDMGVSKNSGTPKSSTLIGFSIINHPFWGTTIFGNIHIFWEWTCQQINKDQAKHNKYQYDFRMFPICNMSSPPQLNIMDWWTSTIWSDFHERWKSSPFESILY